MRRIIFIFLILVAFAFNLIADDLKVTYVKKFPVKREGSKVKAYVTFKLNNVILIRDAKIIEGKYGKFVAMPSKKYKGEWKDICFPITKKLRETINKAILEDKFGPISIAEQKVDITEIKIYKIKNPKGKVKAFASITLNDSFVIKDIKIIEGSNGLFIGWPSRRVKEGKYKKVVYPVKKKKEIEEAILNKYKQE